MKEAPSVSREARSVGVFHHYATDRGGNGFGCMEIERTHPVSAFEDIHEIGAVIQDVLDPNGQKGVKVCVLNWTPFEASLPGPGAREPAPEENNVVLRLIA